MMHIDVLIVNYGTGELAAEAAELVTGPGVHVWAWDNSGEMLADPPRTDLVLLGDGSNTWYAPANNRLYEQCDGPLVLLLNPDVQLAHAALLRLAGTLERDPLAWGVAPRLLNADGSDQRYLHALPDLPSLLADRLPFLRPVLRTSHRRYTAASVDLRRSQVVEQPAAACLLVRRTLAGPRLFDESYRLFFNDTDLARRLNTSAHCLYAADVTAMHLRGESFARMRPRSGRAIAREYDEALLRYARRNVRGWPVLVAVVLARRLVITLLDAFDSRRKALAA